MGLGLSSFIIRFDGPFCCNHSFFFRRFLLPLRLNAFCWCGKLFYQINSPQVFLDFIYRSRNESKSEIASVISVS